MKCIMYNLLFSITYNKTVKHDINYLRKRPSPGKVMDERGSIPSTTCS